MFNAFLSEFNYIPKAALIVCSVCIGIGNSNWGVASEKKLEFPNFIVCTGTQADELIGLIKKQGVLRKRIDIESKQKRLLEIFGQEVADEECAKHNCGENERCARALKYSVSLRTPTINDLYCQIDFLTDDRSIEFHRRGESQIDAHELLKESYFIDSILCTSSYSGNLAESGHPETSSILSDLKAEATDLVTIASQLVPAVAEGGKQIYKDSKASIGASPKDTVMASFYRFASMVAPGMAGSQWLGERAKVHEDNIYSSRMGVENISQKLERLEEVYKGVKDSFNPINQEAVNIIFSKIKFYLVHGDHSGDLPQMLKQVEAIFRLPQKPKYFRPNQEGEALLQMFEKYHIPSDLAGPLYNQVQILSAASKSESYIPMRPIFLQGAPGIGKTFVVREAAKALRTPLCEIKLGGVDNIETYLLGGTTWGASGRDNHGLGKLVECMTQQRNPDGTLAENTTKTVILFFDELDQALNRDKTGTTRQFFLDLFNSAELGKIKKAKGIEGAEVDFRFALMAAASNNIIKPQEAVIKELKSASSSENEALPSLGDPAFESRFSIVQLKGYSEEEKRKIANQMLESAMTKLKLDRMSAQGMENHEALIKRDARPGMRVLEAAIYANVVHESSEQDGWKMLSPFDVDAALRKTDEEIKMTQGGE